MHELLFFVSAGCWTYMEDWTFTTQCDAFIWSLNLEVYVASPFNKHLHY